MEASDRSTQIIAADFSSLAPYTKFPFVLLLSQSVTEKVLENRLMELGVSVLKPERVIGLNGKDDGHIDVLFESGRVITAKYVIGADGARSTVSYWP
jgi:2-polyprenyl-6-methoxyphenol hydroxylase-like FAD-dependent oxidoreductase